ncbi:hypothetical protein [Nocardia sp. NPDC058705]|uniref:hypothetical protein n=1 Tax=Nocardia sp. NPDC058705 TaxID=3346609 RepID=UPI0036CF8C61
MSPPGQHSELRLTAEEFLDGAADELGDIEIVNGRVVRLRAQSALHSRVVRRLAGLLEAARRDGGPCMVVDSVHRRVLLLDDPVEVTVPFDVLEQS